MFCPAFTRSLVFLLIFIGGIRFAGRNDWFVGGIVPTIDTTQGV